MKLLGTLAGWRGLAACEGVLLVIAMSIAFVQGPPSKATTDPAQLVTLHGVPLVAAGWIVLVLAYQYLVYRRIETFEYRDATAHPQMPVPKIAAEAGQLFSIGFRPFGEMEARFPWQTWKHLWVLVDSGGHVDAVFGLGSPALGTSWADGTFVTTVRRRGQTVRTPRGWLVSVPVRTPWQEIYRRHLAEAYAFGTGRPEPLRTTTITDYLASTAASISPSRDTMRAAFFRPVMIGMYAILIAVLLLVAATPT